MFGAKDWDRTSDTRIFNPLLYHLSYIGIIWWAIEDSNLATSLCEKDRISNHSKAYCMEEGW